MTIKRKLCLSSLLCAAISSPCSALVLNFDYSYDSNGFFSDPARKTTLQAAGSFFENILLDDFTAINSGGVNSYTAVFSNPADGSTVSVSNFSVAADTVTIFVGGRSLGGSTLGVGGFGGYSIGGTQNFLDNAITRGESGIVQGSGANEFALWGGSIAFDTDSAWYFDSNPATNESFSGNDFYSVALHELGHVFGIGTADSWSSQVNTAGDFTGATSILAYGGNVPLSADGAHWANGTFSDVNGVSQQAAMAPSIVTGSRNYFTRLDRAALDDIGWDVAPVPVPPAVWLFGSGMLALLGLGRRKIA